MIHTKKGAQKAPFFLLVLLLSFNLISCQYFYPLSTNQNDANTSSNNEAIYGTVKKVIDGDSIELSTGEKIRYKGINAPEKNQHLYKEALSFNSTLVSGKQVRLEFDNERKDQYGRTLSYVFVGQVLVNQEIINAGLAFVYNESKIGKFKGSIIKSLENAQQNKKGLWQKSIYSLKIITINANAPGEDTKNVNGEWIEIRNNGQKSVQLSNFILQDESNNQFFFPNLTCPPNSIVRVFSGMGRNERQDLYWGNLYPIWNNDSDQAYLFDNQNKLVDFYKYP